MAATDQQLIDEARDSLLRIMQTDSSSWSDERRSQQQLEIDKLEAFIDRRERKLRNATRRIHFPVRRVDA